MIAILAAIFASTMPAVAPDNADLRCLTSAIAFEAGFEPVAGKQAVAEVVLNRMRHPGFPKTVCGVVFEGSARRTGCQFSFTCDGSLRRTLPSATIAASRAVAEQALAGLLPDRLDGATHYHADYVSPAWAPALVRVTQIGAHIFYRQPQSFERRAIPIMRRMPETPPPPAPTPFAPWGLATPGPAS